MIRARTRVRFVNGARWGKLVHNANNNKKKSIGIRVKPSAVYPAGHMGRSGSISAYDVAMIHEKGYGNNPRRPFLTESWGRIKDKAGDELRGQFDQYTLDFKIGGDGHHWIPYGKRDSQDNRQVEHTTERPIDRA